MRFAAVLALLLLAAPSARADMVLLMLEQAACEWCDRWNEEIGGAYALTEEGQQAPLQRRDIHEPLPEDIELSARAHFTPTFVLLEQGREVGRISGYPGPDFFYPMLARLIAQAGVATN